ncbi:hypothetical protein AB0G86_01855 [Streptomyces scabiei]|uniref:hypothetical protein n=1 Tax=Streptomyces scabiei TaxID=1930 RepID=UPI0033EC5AE2
MGDSGESVHPLTWAILSASFALIVAGYGIASYHEAAVRYTKIQQADEWLQVVHAHRVKVLALREKNLVRAIGELQDRFEVEKAALQEIREERMAHERMMGFVDGLQKSPAMRAFMENPRNRLRVVRDEDEESA